VPDSGLGLSVRRERRPIVGDARVVVDQSALGQPVHDGGGGALGARHDHGDRVFVIGPVVDLVPARPDVDDLPAIAIDAELGAARVVRLRGAERVAHAFVSPYRETLHAHAAPRDPSYRSNYFTDW